jgi:hypothetical protein
LTVFRFPAITLSTLSDEVGSKQRLERLAAAGADRRAASAGASQVGLGRN